MSESLTPELEAELSKALAGEIRFDSYTRHLYSTDASLYAIEPLGVAFPRDRTTSRRQSRSPGNSTCRCCHAVPGRVSLARLWGARSCSTCLGTCIA